MNNLIRALKHSNKICFRAIQPFQQLGYLWNAILRLISYFNVVDWEKSIVLLVMLVSNSCPSGYFVLFWETQHEYSNSGIPGGVSKIIFNLFNSALWSAAPEGYY